MRTPSASDGCRGGRARLRSCGLWMARALPSVMHPAHAPASAIMRTMRGDRGGGERRRGARYTHTWRGEPSRGGEYSYTWADPVDAHVPRVARACRTLACCVRSGGRASLARRRLVTYGWLRADVPEGAVSDGTCVCEMNRGIPCACRGVVDRSRWAEERLIVQSARGTARAASPPRSPPSVCIGCRTDVRP